MNINNKTYDLKLSMAVVWRYASHRNISIAKVSDMLENLTMDDMLGLIAFSDRDKKLTIDFLYNELDNNPDIITQFANFINESLGEQKPQTSGKVTKAKN
jgi:predicted lipase